MSDASQRRLTDFQETNPDHPRRYHPTSMATLPEAPMPSGTLGMSLGQTKKGVKPAFPPGITNMEAWSQTMIEFGKFAGKDMTYGEGRLRS